MAGHLDELFSSALDGELSERERRQFDTHLSGCGDCRDGFARFASAISLVRALPPARMPVPVRLPVSIPATSHGLKPGLWHRLGSLRGLSPQWAALGAAMAAGVAVFVVFHHPTQTQFANVSGGLSAAGTPATDSGAGAGRLAIPTPQSQAGGGCGAPVQASTFTREAVPAGFGNSVSQQFGSRPGETLVLATEQASYAPGSRVLVYARLLAPHGGEGVTTVLPCVTVSGPASARPPGVADGAVPQAQSTQSLGSSGLPLQVISIPADLTPGSRVTLVASVPGGVPAGEPAVSVELVVRVG